MARIVIAVEDDPGQRLVMTTLLRPLAQQHALLTQVVENESAARAALTALPAQAQVLLLSDQNLPDGDGRSLAQWATSNLGDRVTPCILSATPLQDNELWWEEKAMGLAKMRAMLESVVERWRAQ